jgi:phosphoribosyl 1,2-cyclic phosphate phosphodiesterase
MKITYFGTSASEAWPAMFCNCEACKKARELREKNLRTRHQALIDESLLLDFPPDTNYHIQQYGLDLRKVKTLLVTHSHPDHFYPFDLANRSSQFTNGKSNLEILDIYGNAAVKKLFFSAMEGFEGIDTVIRFHEIAPFDTFATTDGYSVTALEADHEKREQSLIYKIEKNHKQILFAHDTGIFPEATWEYLRGNYFDYISLDCTGLLHDWRSGHMGFKAVKMTCERLRRMNCIDDNTIVALSHFAHGDGLTHERITEIAEKSGYIAAYDTFACEV